MSTLAFSLAKRHDAKAIMQFMDTHWRKNHVLSRSQTLLMKDFQDARHPDQLTLGLAKSSDGEILGLFGFIYYNQMPLPDIAGSLWKVTDEAQKAHPMLGIQLRNFVIQSISHRFFAAPGAGLQTQTIYQILRMNWHRMEQFFRINPTLPAYHLVKFPPKTVLPTVDAALAEAVTLVRVAVSEAETQLEAFDFSAYPHLVPFKDKAYVLRRFFDYPFYEYDVYLVYKNPENNHSATPCLADFDLKSDVKTSAENIIVCRRASVEYASRQTSKQDTKLASAYRVVDFYGEESLMPNILSALAQKMVEVGDEFLDFIGHGFDPDLMQQGGMMRLDFESQAWVVPNFFEPLLQKNVPVYCVSDKTDLKFRQCKADGDQDRPNG